MILILFKYIGDTLGNIRKRNEKMFNATKDQFLQNVEKSASPVKPPNFEEIVSINRGLVQAGMEKCRSLKLDQIVVLYTTQNRICI